MKKQRIVLRDIEKSYDGKAVISGFSADISTGSAIMGESGKGKTTLGRIIAGIERADSGSVDFSGKPTFSVVFQDDRLFEDFSAIDNVALAAPKGKDKREARAEAAELLSLMRIDESEQNKPVSTFSGGMKRRVALARALTKESDILLLDEPFKGLDTETRRVCAEIIRERAKERLLLLITHDKTEAELLGIENILNL